jgi:nucleotide-binding universal stress UspA family protein
MFKRILAPVDLSARNDRALRVAADLAASGGARVTLLHVVQRVEGLPATELVDFYAQLEERARTKLEALARRLAKRGADVHVEVRVGDPTADIVAHADRMKADVIVMASHRLEPRKGIQALGTTSYKTAIVCRCPILLVK